MPPSGGAPTVRLVTEESPRPPVTGATVMREVAELIAARLPDVPLDDPYRGSLSALLMVGGGGR